ncbi:hypothetical protein R3P38DRAFT_2852415 [Favolaschia claudopus]|uniref:Uncharacterized protein n=1 Tax=Favolaschia claudopus TaxID=2862362 RepID=A0AAW0DR36_9AGAR
MLLTPLLRVIPLLLSLSFFRVSAQPSLDQHQQQLLSDRLWQTTLRGPRWTGNDNQNTLTSLVTNSMKLAGLDVATLNYTLNRWDPQWWSLSIALTNGTTLGVRTTGYWPYSGNSGLEGVTAPVIDSGTLGLLPNQNVDPNSLSIPAVPPAGAIMFFDNPSPTHNYSQPGYGLLGTSRNIRASAIPELGNLTNPHWQATKTLNFTSLRAMGIRAAISSWVHTSDEDAALQFLPNDGPVGGDNALYDVPTLYVGNSTGEMIRGLIRENQIVSATVVLYAPSYSAPTQTVLGHLSGTANTTDTIIIYTHSDGPSIVEENGPIILLAMAEYFAQHIPTINLDFVITTGHFSGHRLNESLWMEQRPDIVANAKFAIACEHFGAMEWKDQVSANKSTPPVYKATGKLEPMWTMANESKASDELHQLYLSAFAGTPDTLRMALIAPLRLNGTRSMWYGVGGASELGHSNIPTIGIIPQPDYLWTSMVDGGWSKLDIPTVVTQINVILRLVSSLDARYAAGTL